MIDTTLRSAIIALGATRVIGAPDASGGEGTLRGVSTDSRTLGAGDLYVALQGERFDGSAFARDAAAAGAAAVVLQDSPQNVSLLEELNGSFGTAGVLVRDPLDSLGRLAGAARARLGAEHGTRVVAITGSCGKTSTKELVQTMLAASLRTVASPASFNNAIGVPHTVFLASERTEALVLEVGTNGPGEIADLARIARPDVALITNIGRTHLEGLGSREGVAVEKGALFEALSGGVAIVNADDPLTPRLVDRVPAGTRVLSFSTREGTRAALCAERVRMTPQGAAFVLVDATVPGGRRYDVELPLLGEHAVANALAAFAVVRALDGDLGRAIEAVTAAAPAARRLVPHSAGGVHIIDDTYNANPESMAAALAVLGSATSTGRRVFVAGAMGEMGPDSGELHRELGAAFAEADLDRLVIVGDASVADDLDALAAGAAGLGPSRITRLERAEDATTLLSEWVQPGDRVIVKASRSQRLEDVVEGLLRQLEPTTKRAKNEHEVPA